MLPTHAARQRRKIRLDASPKTQLLDSLTRRSRITNLGVLLISALAALSLIYNIHLWLRLASQELYGLQQQPTLFSVLATIARPPVRKTLNHLIIVPCHSIWTGHDSWNREEDWMLESYQTGSARVQAFVQHITKRSGCTFPMTRRRLIHNPARNFMQRTQILYSCFQGVCSLLADFVSEAHTVDRPSLRRQRQKPSRISDSPTRPS